MAGITGGLGGGLSATGGGAGTGSLGGSAGSHPTGTAGGPGSGGGGGACSSSTSCGQGFSCVNAGCVANRFTGSPCVATDTYSEFVFGHGVDGAVHQRAYLSGSWQPWTSLNIDTAAIDPNSSLDCSGNGNIIQLVAVTSNPAGEILQTSGSGDQFSEFTHVLGTEAFSPLAASIAAWPSGDDYMLGAFDTGPVLWTVEGQTFTPVGQISGQVNSFNSAIHVGIQLQNPAQIRLVVGYETSGQLGIYANALVGQQQHWEAPIYLSPPAGTFAYAPAICVNEWASANYTIHVVGSTSNGQIWDTYTPQLESTPFSGWEEVGSGAASAVDCTLMSDGTVRIVALDSQGHVLDLSGSPGSWTKTDLGVF